MNSWKTSLTGVIGAIAIIVGNYGFKVSEEVQIAIVTIVLFLIGLFAKDSDVTGGKRDFKP